MIVSSVVRVGKVRVRSKCVSGRGRTHAMFNLQKDGFDFEAKIDLSDDNLDETDFLFFEIEEDPKTFYILSKKHLTDRKLYPSKKTLDKIEIVIPTDSCGESSEYDWIMSYQNYWELMSGM